MLFLKPADLMRPETPGHPSASLMISAVLALTWGAVTYGITRDRAGCGAASGGPGTARASSRQTLPFVWLLFIPV